VHITYSNMNTQQQPTQVNNHINHVLDNYRTEKITEIESRVSMARAQGHKWCLLKCYYLESDSGDNIAELVRTTTCSVDGPGAEYNLFYTAIVPVMNHFQSRGYIVELVNYIGQCDLILRWS
jgi:hypothetical protein